MSKSIELTQNKVTVVDDEYYEELSKFKWYAAEIKPSCFYTIRNYRSEDGKRHSLRLHRVVWEIKNGRIPVGVQIDHINHDTLDNRLENLRLCNTSENQANQRKSSNKLSKFKGVTWYKARNKWELEYVVIENYYILDCLNLRLQQPKPTTKRLENCSENLPILIFQSRRSTESPCDSNRPYNIVRRSNNGGQNYH